MKVAQLALYGGMLKSQKGIDMKCRPSPTSTRERGAEKFPSGLPTHFAASSIADSFGESVAPTYVHLHCASAKSCSW